MQGNKLDYTKRINFERMYRERAKHVERPRVKTVFCLNVLQKGEGPSARKWAEAVYRKGFIHH